MKRIVLWGLSTLSAVVVLFGYHTSTSSVMATSTESAFSGSLQGQATSGTGSSTTTSGAAPPSDSTSGSADGASSGSSSGTSTVTGAAAQTRYGPVQVQLEVSGSTITNVSVLQYPDSDGRDLQISSYSLPRLIQGTLDAQGSGVSMVSGATYTSQGYLQSLQSAIDQGGL
ncbi:FMN-binding protein [Nocardioides sp.]|uniref:FMN-binding protein n=1 Tax=Nocardioides sp. TaxID=35761 RepID=UPI00261AE373|nr:FMN-binding protein [Nocardioides sp.]